MQSAQDKGLKESILLKAEKVLRAIKSYIRKNDFERQKHPPLIEQIIIMKPPVRKGTHRYKEISVRFTKSVIDLEKLKGKLKDANILFKDDIDGIKIGEHIVLQENHLFIGVDTYNPQLMEIVSECLVEPKKLKTEIMAA